MDMNAYQKSAIETAVYPWRHATVYPILGLLSEAGEVAGKLKRDLRGEVVYPREIALELGDCLWYLSVAAKDLGFTLEEIAQMNLDKLKDRAERGVLKGTGDER